MRPMLSLAAFTLFALTACGGGGEAPDPEVLGARPPTAPPRPPKGGPKEPEPTTSDWPAPALSLPTSPVTTIARITALNSSVPRMAPSVVHVHAADSSIAVGDFHTARFRWIVAGPTGWQPAVARDPRRGLQEGDSIALDRDCEGFNFALLADAPGRYTIGLEVWDEAGAISVATHQVEVAADTRTTVYVSGTGSDTSGDGSAAKPWRSPTKAWAHILANGKVGFNVRVERGYSYVGFGHPYNASGVKNVAISAYGGGASPILQWSAASYPAGDLLTLRNCEAIVVQDLQLLGNDADRIHGSAISIHEECADIAFVGLSFGGADGTNSPNICIMTHANDSRPGLPGTIPLRQNSGIGMFNCSGYSPAYWFYGDMPSASPRINTTDFAPTSTEFEVDAGELVASDDAYNGMKVCMLAGNSDLHNNQQVTILDYIGSNAGHGRPKIVLSAPLAQVPVAGNLAFIADVGKVGDSDIFFFGCVGKAQEGATEARVRIMNAKRVTVVGSKMDSLVTVGAGKEGWRMMADYFYFYRSFERGGMSAANGISTGGLSVFEPVVIDRSFLSSLPTGAKAIDFAKANKVSMRGCVVLGGANEAAHGNALALSEFPNCAGSEFRLVHNTILTRVDHSGPFHPGTTIAGWALNYIQAWENNLVVAGDTWIYGPSFIDYSGVNAVASIVSAKNNVYYPDRVEYAQRFRHGAGFYALDGWNSQLNVDSEAYGTIDYYTLLAADFVPDPLTYVPETTNRTFTSKGIYQDYYGGDPRGAGWVGAVSRSP